jgi:hypothetical protein
VTPTLSVAVKLLIGTVSVLEVDGMVKAVTVGGVVSESVIVTLALRLAETLLAASLAQAYRVLEPAVGKVYAVGAVAAHPAAPAEGAVADSVAI